MSARPSIVPPQTPAGTPQPTVAALQKLLNEQSLEMVNLQQVIANQSATIERITLRFGAAQLNFENAQAQLQQR